MIDAVKTGRKLKEAQLKNGISVQKIADQLYVSKIAVYKWFRGEQLPSLDNLYELSKLLNFKIDDILEEAT